MPKITLYELDELQLEDIISRAVDKALKAQHIPVDEVRTRREVASFFRVTEKTVDNWSGEGLLIKHVVGGKVFWKQNEIEQAAQSLGKWKKPH